MIEERGKWEKEKLDRGEERGEEVDRRGEEVDRGERGDRKR